MTSATKTSQLKSNKPATDHDMLSAKAVAKAQRINPIVLWRLIEEGRVPGVEKVGTRWILSELSVKFLRKWYSKRKRLAYRGTSGEAARQRMCKAAARLDPQCAERQEQTKPRYQRNKKAARTAAREAAQRRKLAGKRKSRRKAA